MQIDIAKQKISGFDYLLQRLEIRSGVGRSVLSGLQWYVPGTEKELDVELSRVESIRDFIARRATVPLDKLKQKFAQVWDIRPTFHLMEKETVDDVQLFEIKRFSMLVRDAAVYLTELVHACGLHPAPEPMADLSEVIDILDPRKENIPTFHIYDEYSPDLARLRKELARLDAEAASVRVGSAAELEGLEAKQMDDTLARIQTECENLERDIREQLTIKLRPLIPALQKAMLQVAYWDILTAKAGLAFRYGLVRPQLQSSAKADMGGTASWKGKISYKELFHPMVKEILEEKKHRYQKVDICLNVEPCLLTGANMSGKTVLLKSLALSQCMLQFGFLVPASEASLFLLDDVAILVQDDQDEERGLSSFGAEMMGLNRVFARLRSGERLLLLIDELARTTNPVEGKAIVCAVLDQLQEFGCVSLVSTHFGPIPNPVRRLRVRGFRQDWAEDRSRVQAQGPSQKKEGEGEDGHLDISRIQACMDYSLVEEVAGQQPPMEALRIASLLGFDPEVLQKAYRYYTES